MSNTDDASQVGAATLLRCVERGGKTGALAKAEILRRLAPAEIPTAAVGQFSLDERDDDMLICERHWQFGWRCLARRPKLMTNDEWRPDAQRIINALSAPQDGLTERYRTLTVAAQRVLDRGYVSQHIEEEREDYLALYEALSALQHPSDEQKEMGE